MKYLLQSSDSYVGFTFALRLLALLLINLLFEPGWVYYTVLVLSLKFNQIAIMLLGLLFGIWKYKFWYWAIPSFFHWMLTVWPSQ